MMNTYEQSDGSISTRPIHSSVSRNEQSTVLPQITHRSHHTRLLNSELLLRCNNRHRRIRHAVNTRRRQCRRTRTTSQQELLSDDTSTENSNNCNSNRLPNVQFPQNAASTYHPAINSCIRRASNNQYSDINHRDAYLCQSIIGYPASCNANNERLLIQSLHNSDTAERASPFPDTTRNCPNTAILHEHRSHQRLQNSCIPVDVRPLSITSMAQQCDNNWPCTQNECPLQVSTLRNGSDNPTDRLPPPYSTHSMHRERRLRPASRSRHRSRRQNRARRHTNIQLGNINIQESNKLCCNRATCRICLSGCLKFQRVLIMLTTMGICCVITGVTLGVLRSPVSSFLTLALMFVGLGLLLIAVVLIGWKCTPPDHEPCHLLFGLGAYSMVRRSRTTSRLHGDRYYWVGGMLYPEFRYRRPPPSYAASMQEYQNLVNQLRTQSIVPRINPGSPPPSYKSHVSAERPGVHLVFPMNFEHSNSRPPTYRLTSQTRPSIQIFNETNINNETTQSCNQPEPELSDPSILNDCSDPSGQESLSLESRLIRNDGLHQNVDSEQNGITNLSFFDETETFADEQPEDQTSCTVNNTDQDHETVADISQVVVNFIETNMGEVTEL